MALGKFRGMLPRKMFEKLDTVMAIFVLLNNFMANFVKIFRP